jgi:hypothetical protein
VGDGPRRTGELERLLRPLRELSIGTLGLSGLVAWALVDLSIFHRFRNRLESTILTQLEMDSITLFHAFVPLFGSVILNNSHTGYD